jgi:hypothetical protein
MLTVTDQVSYTFLPLHLEFIDPVHAYNSCAVAANSLPVKPLTNGYSRSPLTIPYNSNGHLGLPVFPLTLIISHRILTPYITSIQH